MANYLLLVHRINYEKCNELCVHVSLVSRGHCRHDTVVIFFGFRLERVGTSELKEVRLS